MDASDQRALSFQRWLLKYARFENGSLRASVLSLWQTGTCWRMKSFPADILSVGKKNPHELMRILKRMILPKNTIVSTGFFWQIWQISAAPSDRMKLCLWLNLFISAFWSSVCVTVALCIQLLCRLSAPDTHCYSALCFQHYSSEIPSLSKHWLSLP